MTEAILLIKSHSRMYLEPSSTNGKDSNSRKPQNPDRTITLTRGIHAAALNIQTYSKISLS